MVKQFCFVVVYCWLWASVVSGIDVDYLFGSALRSVNEDEPETGLLENEYCQKDIPRYICQMGCYDNHICLKGKCWCIDNSLTLKEDAIETLLRKKVKGVDFLDFTREDLQVDSDESESYPQQLALRHHIAHFCPNLNIARTCIIKCMSEGKPAFCGKDHQCYCGHKYTEQSVNKKQDANVIYKKFRDMYEKYFGKDYNKN